MTDTRLKIFCLVAQTLSFSKAAKLANISQAAVSKNIAALEKEIGSALFLRIGKNIMITDKGRELEAIAKQILMLYVRIDSLATDGQ